MRQFPRINRTNGFALFSLCGSFHNRKVVSRFSIGIYESKTLFSLPFCKYCSNLYTVKEKRGSLKIRKNRETPLLPPGTYTHVCRSLATTLQAVLSTYVSISPTNTLPFLSLPKCQSTKCAFKNQRHEKLLAIAMQAWDLGAMKPM